MERNDAVMPGVAIVVAALMWVLLLWLFNNETQVPKVEVNPQLKAAAAKEWPTIGKKVFEGAQPACAGCHGVAGQGGAGPKLVGDEHVDDTGLIVNNIRKGKGIMPAYPNLSDAEIIAVTNYIRNSWGNKYGVVGPEVLQAAVSNIGPEVLRVRSRFVPEDIKLPEIFLGTFVMVLLTYGVIGLFSVWAEGTELHVGIHKNRSNPIAVLFFVATVVSAAIFSILFAIQIVKTLSGQAADPPAQPSVTTEGLYSAMIFLSLAAALGIYMKYFKDSQVLVEDASGEFPW
ncbi:c-type cytochrome [Deinococcus yavapaiensis]|uniref:Mono/diheme cytochrome c family protein n=1 Tax=Deinococcus yavapaiensis KR-236 TaxID=694435 RepID=A0A318S6D5_9DEIO|nr:cytochrome c [Deinococcus yavapaiensis]PYE54453.1 mono/diheme cytochrome c family protein [Deinococcus yavapaiensis KR-236]